MAVLTNELNKPENEISHIATHHEIVLNENKLVKQLGTNKQTVNSYHNQDITNSDLAPSLRSFAIATDETIEGLYHPKHNLAGIMWHPERDSSSKLLDNFSLNLLQATLAYLLIAVILILFIIIMPKGAGGHILPAKGKGVFVVFPA